MTHGVTFHLWAALRYRECSPGLVTSTLYWLLVYLIGRHIHETGEPTSHVWTGVISGIIGVVVAIKENEDEVTLRTDDASNTRIRVLKSSVVRVTSEEQQQPAASTTENKTS